MIFSSLVHSWVASPKRDSIPKQAPVASVGVSDQSIGVKNHFEIILVFV